MSMMPPFTGSTNTTTSKREVITSHVAAQVEEKFQRLYRRFKGRPACPMAPKPRLNIIPEYKYGACKTKNDFGSGSKICRKDIFRRLQSVQNAAARLITGTRRRDHITPVLRDLHWLPVRRRVDYKLALLVYMSLHGLAPSYLADDCILASSDKFRRRLRSANVDTCIVPRTPTRFGDGSFSAAGPRICDGQSLANSVDH